MQFLKKNSKTLFRIIVLFFFAVFLYTGLKIYDDYGPVSEEKNQIDAGHIIWAEITGDKSHYPELPSLAEYMNRYYGQGATFITVLLEAAFGFTWDVNRIWKLRRLWNFICFFCASFCLFQIIKRRYNSYPLAFLGTLSLILLPRMFPEIFYNDRDPLFLSWIIFSLSAMLLFLRKTNLFTTVLFASVMALTINIRMFGFILIIPLILIFLNYPGKRRWLFFIVPIFFLVWYGLSPIAWGNPIEILKTAVVHLTTQQRILDTQGSTQILFNGVYYPEQELPWFYLPLWILISTPLMLLCLGLIGGGYICKHPEKDNPGYFIIDITLAASFLFFIIGIPILRPTLYSGWRHFYFLNLSLVWFSIFLLNAVIKSDKRWLKYMLFSAEICSLAITLASMINAHPYEGIYYNPAFRSYAPDKFERDMGFTSTLECLDYLLDASQEQRIEVMNANAFVPFSLIGLPKGDRERFSTIDWKIQRTPMKYVIFNYNNMQGNDMSFPYYAPIYNIEQNGTKLAEIFQRTNNGLLDPSDIVESIHTTFHDNAAAYMLTEDQNMIWTGAEQHNSDEKIILEFSDNTEISSIELFPGDHTEACKDLLFSTSSDGNSDWKELSSEQYGTNGWLFHSPPEKFLCIQSNVITDQPWQLRQILIYGKTVPFPESHQNGDV